jgi:hypothetical protein
MKSLRVKRGSNPKILNEEIFSLINWATLHLSPGVHTKLFTNARYYVHSYRASA